MNNEDFQEIFEEIESQCGNTIELLEELESIFLKAKKEDPDFDPFELLEDSPPVTLGVIYSLQNEAYRIRSTTRKTLTKLKQTLESAK